MKYFFILKDEFIKSRENSIENNTMNGTYFFISEEEQLKEVIQLNKISMYRKIPSFSNGDVVLLRDTPGVIWVRGMYKHFSKTVTVNLINLNGTFDFIENRGVYRYFIDSVVEVMKA